MNDISLVSGFVFSDVRKDTFLVTHVAQKIALQIESSFWKVKGQYLHDVEFDVDATVFIGTVSRCYSAINGCGCICLLKTVAIVVKKYVYGGRAGCSTSSPGKSRAIFFLWILFFFRYYRAMEQVRYLSPYRLFPLP